MVSRGKLLVCSIWMEDKALLDAVEKNPASICVRWFTSDEMVHIDCGKQLRKW